MKKIINLIKYSAKKIFFIDKLTEFIINRLTYKEYLYPQFKVYNERPIEYRFVFEQITELKPQTILDIGTGTTALPSLMANCGAKVTAIDNIKDYWESNVINHHYHVINDDITDTKLKSKFDLITCISTLEHIEEYNKAINSMFSLLNEKGHIILTFPYNEKKGFHNVYEIKGSETKKLPNYKTRAFERKDIDKWIRENISRVVKQEFWKLYTGEYWRVGEKLRFPQKTSAQETHQISCLLIQKL